MSTPVRRRDVITILGGATACWPLVAHGQSRSMPMIGYLGARNAAYDAPYIEAFRRGLAELGLTLGQNVGIEFRWSEGQNSRLPALATELVRRRVNVLVAAGGAAAPAAKAATSTIPIVFSTGSDPVNSGLVASVNRPGGNLTGLTTLSRELGAKRIGLLRDLVPGNSPMAFLIDPREADAENNILDVQEAVRQSGREFVVFRVRSDSDIQTAFVAMNDRAVGALLVNPSASFQRWTGLMVALAIRHGVPAMYSVRDYAAAGGLISYGTSFTDAYRNVGFYTGRILKGAKPADLPVMQPTKFELVINLGTAKALGLTIPPGLLAIADEVIE